MDSYAQQRVARCAYESIGLLDGHVHDVVLAVFPALDVGIFVDDQRAQVAAVEHHDVRGPGLGVEVNEGTKRRGFGMRSPWVQSGVAEIIFTGATT